MNRVGISALLLSIALLALGLGGCKNEDDDGGNGSAGSTVPEISVSRGADIPDGGTDNLGSTPFGTPQTLTYTINNTGGAQLLLTGAPAVIVTPVTNCSINVTTQPTSPVAAAGNTTCVISLTVTAGGAFSATVSIANDDSDENPFNFTISGTGATVPEIDVQRPASTSIADGGNDALGSGFVVGANPAITWTIANSGTAVLNLTGGTPVTTSNLTNCTVAITQPATATVAAAGSTTFQLTITTLATGAFSFQFHVASDDADENPYDVNVSGSVPVPVPEIDVQRPAGTSIPSTTTDNVGNAPTGTSTPFTWTIANTGTAVLNLTGAPAVQTSGATNCTVSVTQPTSTSITGPGTTTFVIGITPGASAAFSVSVSIANNDANENPYTFTISGTGTAVGALTVHTSDALITSGSSTSLGTLAQDTAIEIPVALRNTGSGALTMGTATVTGATNCVASVRDQPPGTLAVNESATLVLLLATQGSGAISFTVNVPNNGAQPLFSFALTAAHCNSTSVLYLESGANGINLRAGTFPGTPTTTTLNGAITPGGAQGVMSYFHLVDRCLFTAQLAPGGPTNLFFRGIPPAAPATPQAVTTATHVGTTGSAGSVVFTSGDNLAFIASVNAGPGEVWTCTLSGTTVGTPIKISGAVAGGAGGAFGLFPSPRGDMIAFLGAFDTAGTNELYLMNTNGTGSRVKLNAALSAGRTINSSSIRWLPDQRGVLYEEDNFGSSPRHLFFARATATPTPTRLNTVPSSGIGVRNTFGFTPVNHVQVSVTGDRVFFLFNDVAGGITDLMLASIPLSGAPTVSNCSSTVTGALNGVTGYSINHSGSRAVFVADSGNSNVNELYATSVSGTTPTTTRIIQVTTAGRAGVKFNDTKARVSSFRFWFTNDDVTANRQELFFTDVTGAALNTRLPGPGTFPAGSAGVLADTGVFPHPDGGRIVFATNQKVGAGNNYCLHVTTVSTSPTATQISVAAASGPGAIVLSGERVAYAKSNGSAPDHAFTTLLTGTTASEVQLSNGEMGAGAGAGGFYSSPFVIFSTGRVIYRFFNNIAGQIEGIATANTSGTIVRDIIVLNPNVQNLVPPFLVGSEAR